MRTDEYSLGYGEQMLGFMCSRTAETHAGFFLRRLQPGWRVLDAGCGPGAITLGLAKVVQPGQVVGVDMEDAQFAGAREQAEREGLNVEFRKASAYELPFADAEFDAVFSHALLTHLTDPAAALAELRRVLKSGGLIGLRVSDAGGCLIDAASEGAFRAFAAHHDSRRNEGKDPNLGRKLGRMLRQAGFTVQEQTASYEVLTSQAFQCGAALARAFASLVPAGPAEPEDESLFVALAWCEAIGCAP